MWYSWGRAFLEWAEGVGLGFVRGDGARGVQGGFKEKEA